MAGAGRFSTVGADGGEPGMGPGLRARQDGQRTSDACAEHGGRVHAGMSGAGSEHELREPESDAGDGANCCGTGSSCCDSLRQRAGTDQSALSGVVHRASDSMSQIAMLASIG